MVSIQGLDKAEVLRALYAHSRPLGTGALHFIPGPMSRSVTDSALLLSVMQGPSERDPWTLAGARQSQVSPRLVGHDLHGLRVGFIRLAANPQLDPDFERDTRASLDAFAALG